MESIYFEKKINKNIKLYFMLEDFVHFRTVSLNWHQHQEGAFKIKEIHAFSDLLPG